MRMVRQIVVAIWLQLSHTSLTSFVKYTVGEQGSPGEEENVVLCSCVQRWSLRLADFIRGLNVNDFSCLTSFMWFRQAIMTLSLPL